MPRIKRRPLSPAFFDHEQARIATGDRNDCGVKALSVITGLPYEQCQKALDEAGRKRKGGTFQWQMEQAAGLLGFKLVQLPEEWHKAMIASYPGAHKGLQSLTTHHPRRFKNSWKAVEPLLIHTSRHYAAFRDGQVHDWTANNACRIKNLWRLERIGEPFFAEPSADIPDFMVGEDDGLLIDGKDPLQVLQEEHAKTMLARRSVGQLKETK